jgi:CO/xanthine dehydrogenase Mo-binding subunit
MMHGPVPRMSYAGMIDARERVTGRIPYVINLRLPNMLHARLLRSTLPHGRIVRLDVSRAWRDVAREALELIRVEYAELPGVFEPGAALAADAPLVHEDDGPIVGPVVDASRVWGTNILSRYRLRRGDAERAFAEADEVFEDTFISPAVQHVSLETHACIARVDHGRVSVWSTTQMPHPLRAQLASIFKLPQSHVRITVSTLGGGYGGKIYAKVEPVITLLAQATGRPVRIHLPREEEFVTITQHGCEVKLKTGVKRDGTLVARQATLLYNTGAYAHIGPRVSRNGGHASVGPYDIPNVWVDSYSVYTNTPPAGAFRGFGHSQAVWANESHLDAIAERLGLDPLELRTRNLLGDGDTFATGQVLEDCHYRELLEHVARDIEWTADLHPPSAGREKRGRARGKGLASIIKATLTPSTSTATVKLNEDGSLNVATSSIEMGQGVKTTLAVLAAEQLGLPVERVLVTECDTDVTPYDMGTVSSRSTYAMGYAVVEAMSEVRAQLVRHGAELLEASADDLEIADGRVRIKGSPDRSLGVGDVVRRARVGNLMGRGTFSSKGGLDPETGQGIASHHYHQAAGAAEVEVDLETGRVQVLRYSGAVWAGRVINPVQAELQTEGSITFGLGQALYEEMAFDAGRLQNGNLADYMIPSLKDLPELRVRAMEHAQAGELHGIGEPSLPPVMAAIGNAVFHATGVRVRDLPITPEKVLRGLRELRGNST